MTLRAIEMEFSEILTGQLKELSPLNLELHGPLMAQIHPQIIWGRLQFEHNPDQELPQVQIPGWHYMCFGDISEAVSKYQDIQHKLVGRPWTVHQFLSDGHEAAIIDFLEYGAVVVSKTSLKAAQSNPGVHHFTLPHWLSYVLGHELWGPFGKWTRFHQRIEALLNKHQLLEGSSTVGYYPLKPKAEKIATLGLHGTSIDKAYLLVLPWSFSLSALNKLEEIIQQEF